jgi:hypothetical protein
LTVSVNVAPPVVADEGDSDEMLGTGFVAPEIVKVALLDVPPPGVGLLTVTLADPEVEISVAGTCAVSFTVVT